MIAAARTGETTSDSKGIASMLRPENPPFDSPTRMTAGTAAAMNSQSIDISVTAETQAPVFSSLSLPNTESTSIFSSFALGLGVAAPNTSA